MAGFWAPYLNQGDATRRICGFADGALNTACGVTFSDGLSLAVLRQAHADGRGRSQWFNVLAMHVAAPPSAPKPAPQGFVAKAEAFFWSVMEEEGEAQIAQGQAEAAAGQAIYQGVRDNVWEPAHRFLIRHKVLADGIGVAIDVIGVLAGVAFVVAFSPEIGAVAAVTGFAAAGGSFLLAGADGAVFATEVTGNKEASEAIESSKVTQWVRIAGTIMTLVDIPVGGVRSLAEVKALKIESAEALNQARESEEAAALARERVNKIRNPSKHPGPVARRSHKVKHLAQQAESHRQEAEALSRRMKVTAGRDGFAAFGASPAGAALISAAPPAMVLSQAQKEDDERYGKSLEPAGGLPKDMRLEVRVSGVQKVAR